MEKKWAIMKQSKSSRISKIRFLKGLQAARDAGRIDPNLASRLIVEVQRDLRRNRFNRDLHEGNPHYGLKVV